ncbi:MAG: hypothetical protein Q8O99_02215 [bacterium]|nr:hypothetical protein [bacterium]
MSVEEVNSLGRLVDNLKRDGIPDQIALKANFRKRIIEADTSPEEQNGQRVRAASLKNGTVTVGFNDQLGSSILSISTEAKAEETKPKE